MRIEVNYQHISFEFNDFLLIKGFFLIFVGTKPSRNQLYVGIGYQQLAIQASLKNERDYYNRLALDALEKATQNDINDHLCEYYLSLQYALINNITEALNHIRIALFLRAEHAPSLHLFALLLTASRRPREALTVIEGALEEFSDNLNLLHVKAYLQLYMQDVDVALATVQKMLSIWREQYESQVIYEDEKHSDTKSVILHVPSSQLSDKDSSKIIINISLIILNGWNISDVKLGK